MARETLVRIREAGVTTDSEAAQQDVEGGHPRRVVLARPEVLSEQVDHAGIGVDGPLHRDRLEDPSVNVPASVDEDRGKRPGKHALA